MPQTSRTANDIIVKAFYLIGLSPDEIPEGGPVQEALYYLNDLLDYFSSLGILIPFIKEISFPLVTGKDKYTVSNVIPADVNEERIVELDFVNLIRDSISYPVRPVKRGDIFNVSRNINTKTLPDRVLLIRDNQQSTLQFYPVPSFDYECIVRGKFMLDHLELYDTIEELPPYMFRFLRYAIGREMLGVIKSASWSERQESDYQLMFKNITATSDINMDIRSVGPLGKNNLDYYTSYWNKS